MKIYIALFRYDTV